MCMESIDGHADGTAQWEPAKAGVRADPDLGRAAAQALLNIKVKLEAEIAFCLHLLEEGEDF